MLAANETNENYNGSFVSSTPATIALVKVSGHLVRYVIPVLFSFGTVGNILTIFVLVRRGVNQSTTTFYLFVLSVSDLLCLYVGIPVFYFRELSGINLRGASDAVCRVHTFATYCLTHLVSWTIAAMQVDRTIWVALPFRARGMCTIRNSRIVMFIILSVILLFNNHFLWTLETRILEMDEYPECLEIEEYSMFANHVVGLMDVAMYSLVPSAIMFVCNTVIMIKLRQFAQNRSRLLSSQASLQTHSNASANSSTTEHRPRSGSFTHNTSSKERSLTIMLQTVSTFFIVTTLPVCAINIAYAFTLSSSSDPFSMTAMVVYGLQTFANLLAYLNISVQFILYFFSCKSFRADVREMVKNWLDTRCFSRRLLPENSGESTWNGALTNIVAADFVSQDKLTESIADASHNVAGVAGKSILKRNAAARSAQSPRCAARATISLHT